MPLLLILLLMFFNGSVFSQVQNPGDSLRIEFANKTVQKVKSENDLNFKIIFKNITDRQVQIYSRLVLEKSPSIFGNYDCHLYKKEGGQFKRVEYYARSSPYGFYWDSLYQIYGIKADSVLKLFDIRKKALQPSMTDSLTFNLLHGCHYLDSGEYKMKIFLRVKTRYGRRDGEFAVEDIEYKESDWYQFKVLKDLRSSKLIRNE